MKPAYTDPDWVISARLMWGEPPGREPTASEINLAVWIMLDRGHNIMQTARRTGLERNTVLLVAARRELAAQPDDTGPRPKGGRTPQSARQWAPTFEQRWILHGVGYGRPIGTVRIPTQGAVGVPELVS